MAKAEKKVSLSPSKIKGKTLLPEEYIQSRRTQELVIAFCGPLGSGVSDTAKELKKILQDKRYNFNVRSIKISDFIDDVSKNEKVEKELENQFKVFREVLKNQKALRYATLQEVGNYLRNNYDENILSQLAIGKIYTDRLTSSYDTPNKKVRSDIKTILAKKEHRVAYLVEGLKHPKEVQLLRTVYGNMFYLVGVLCPETIRETRLKNFKRIKKSEAAFIIDRDKSDDQAHRQQLLKTLQLADFFVRNNYTLDFLKKELERYINLIFGDKRISPTKHELAMFVAQSAALRSSCLSRQVGASILNEHGEIIATGCNDVPKKGGLYSAENDNQANDSRCKSQPAKECSNDRYKDDIKEDIKNILKEVVKEPSKIVKLANKISNETRLKDLLEFSRAIHAEMDAIISVARNGKEPLRGCSVYTTLFPCHVCARHIIAAGIDEVYYIDPYEKSLASDLHYDSISIDSPTSEKKSQKVIFQHFHGVAPRQYLNLFQAPPGSRKINGKLPETNFYEARPTIPKYLDYYPDYESKVIEYCTSERHEVLSMCHLDIDIPDE